MWPSSHSGHKNLPSESKKRATRDEGVLMVSNPAYPPSDQSPKQVSLVYILLNSSNQTTAKEPIIIFPISQSTWSFSDPKALLERS